MTMLSPFSAHFNSSKLAAAAEADSTTIEIKQAEINPFLEVIQSYPGIRFSVIDSANTTLGVHWQDFTFELAHQTEEIIITLPAEELVTVESAELMAKLLFSLAFNKKISAQIQTPNRAHEQIIWTICAHLQYPITAQRADQRSRFDFFASDLQRNPLGSKASLKQLERNQHLHIEAESKADLTPISFAEHFQKGQRARHFTQFSLKTDQRNPFFDLFKEFGDVQLTLEPGVGNIIISLGDSKFSIENKAEFFSLSLLNTTMLKIGVAEIVARVLELLVLDFSQGKTHGLARGGIPVSVHSSHHAATQAIWKQLDRNARVKITATTDAQAADLRRLRQSHAYTASRQFSGLLQQHKTQQNTGYEGPSPSVR